MKKWGFQLKDEDKIIKIIDNFSLIGRKKIQYERGWASESGSHSVNYVPKFFIYEVEKNVDFCFVTLHVILLSEKH